MRTLVCLMVGLLGWFNSYAADIAGQWQTISDKDGQPDAIILIAKQGDEYSGTIQKLLRPTKPNPTCEKCPGVWAQKPIEGLRFIWGLRALNQFEYSSGHILDPESGSTYSLKASLEPDEKTLIVRGYLGVSLFGRSQSWQRLPVAK